MIVLRASRGFPPLAFLASLLGLFLGCQPRPQPKTPASAPAANAPLSLLVIDDPQLGQAIAREWRSRTEQDLVVQSATLEEVAAAHRLPGDAIIFPTGLTGQLVERDLIQPLDSAALDEPTFDFRDIFDHIRLREMKWGNRTVAVPLGSPQLLLAYRIDIFEKLGLSPPADWTQFQQVVDRLADRAALAEFAPSSDQPWRAAVEPLADGWAGQLLLARAAAYSLHRDQISPLFAFDSLAPLIDQPPYVTALEELTSAAKAGGFADQRLTPMQAMEELQAGRCAIAIGWPAPHAPQGDSAAADALPVRIGFAKLPGAAKAYRFATKKWETRGEEDIPHVPLLAVSGRMAAVTTSTADQRRAQGFVIWLAGREVGSAISPQSQATTMFRTSQLAEARRWVGALPPDAANQYATALAETMALPRAHPGVRLPGRMEYLAALDKAVEAAVNGDQPPREALVKAAAKWREITEKIGLAEQRRANARSFGQEGP
jgi:multiple sugar transport system substrate-binding protein